MLTIYEEDVVLQRSVSFVMVVKAVRQAHAVRQSQAVFIHYHSQKKVSVHECRQSILPDDGGGVGRGLAVLAPYVNNPLDALLTIVTRANANVYAVMPNVATVNRYVVTRFDISDKLHNI
jgi:hypothetical protein